MARVGEPDIRAFRRAVRSHYRRAGRDMPWRRTRDPYRILVSEIMLQQTQVGRVREYYERFLRTFPTARALAQAAPRDVLRLWQGMGYNRRALFLHRAAQMLMRERGGRLPAEPAELRSLPGIGEGTAGAIAAFAFGAPTVFIETNIRRAFIHWFFPRRRAVSDAEIMPLIERALDRRDPRAWYYALMDYGAMLGQALPKQADPNRRGTGYARQSAFAGSNRELRGRVLRLVLARPRRTADIRRATGVPAERLATILRALAKEGFIVGRRGIWHPA